MRRILCSSGTHKGECRLQTIGLRSVATWQIPFSGLIIGKEYLTKNPKSLYGTKGLEHLLQGFVDDFRQLFHHVVFFFELLLD